MLTLTLLGNVTTFGILHTPLNEQVSHPLVIILHGLVSDKIGTQRTHVHLAEALAEVGCAALRIDLPGHGDSEGQPDDFSLEDYKTSICEIVNYAYKQPYTDKTNLAIFGSSLGATLTLLSIGLMPKIKALALWAPTILGTLWVQDAQNQSIISSSTSNSDNIHYAGIPLSKAFCSQFLEIDISKQVVDIPESLPILHMHGENDTLVSLNHQKLFAQAFKNKNNRLRLLSYPNVDHVLPLNSSSVLSDLITWLISELST
ncbi:alpha/beta hydrolase [Candidatus Chlamydia sanziniae]|nr:alpha/beta hydrolase [Candidatus Chlamydia sanziniae]